MPAIEPITITVYRHTVPGARKRSWFTKAAAYRSAAIAMVNARCDAEHAKCTGPCDETLRPWDGPLEDSCRLCRRVCDGSRRVKHFDGGYPDYEQGSCENDPTHSYRYRLVGRLARWLRWRDAVLAKEQA